MNHWFTFLDQEMIQTLGWTFIHSLWQASIIAIILLLILRKIPSEKASLRYGIATFSLFSIFVTSLCTFIILLESGQSASVESILTTAGTAQESLTQQSLLAGLKIQTETIQQYLPLIVSIWISGMIIFAMRLTGGALYIRLLRQKTEIVPKSVLNKVYDLKKKLTISRKIEVKESAWVGVPMVLGHIKPLILFPVGAINQLNPSELEAILAHELAHIMRNDYLQNIIQSIIETIFYYHPAVWWISAVIRDERENCCDDLAVSLCGSSIGYARALVRLEDMHKARPILAMPIFTSKKKLLNRVKRVLNQPINKSNTMEKSIATFLCLICFLFLSMSATNHKEVTKDKDPIVEATATPFDFKFDFNYLLEQVSSGDTIPPQSTVKITRRSDDQKIELIMKNEEIKSLKIDGKTIPQSEHRKYKDMIAELRQDLPEPPQPPKAPEAPEFDMAKFPPPPPTPPRADRSFPAPAPPAAPHTDGELAVPPVPPMNDLPPMPPMPPVPPMPPMPEIPEMPSGLHNAPDSPFGLFHRSHQRSITKEFDEDGNLTIIIEETGIPEDGDDIFIEGNTVIIDGEKYEGDTVLIFDEKDDLFGKVHKDGMSYFPESRDLWTDIVEGGHDLRIFADTIHFDEKKLNEWSEKISEHYNRDSKEWQNWSKQLEYDFQNNPEWKEWSRQLEQNFQNTDEWKAWSKQLQEQYQNSDEWKKWQEDIKKHYEANGQYQDALKLYGEKLHENGGQWQSKNGELFELLPQNGQVEERTLELLDRVQEQNENQKLKGLIYEGQSAPDGIFDRQNQSFNRLFDAQLERNPVIRKMLREGLIEENDYHVSLNVKRLKVNGKKMSEELHQEYLQFYESQTGTKLEGNSRIEMRNQEKG